MSVQHRRLRAAIRPVGVLAVLCALVVVSGPAALAQPSSPAEKAAQVALSQGASTGVALLDLTTGRYDGGGQDTAAFPSESVVKVLIAVRLLLTGQMDDATSAIAQRMIASSDDGAATALYARAGGDTVVDQVAAHYGIPDLGAPPSVPGRWGLTRITARGVVQLYAAVARDATVGPWLRAAMSAATPIAADGTDQSFGLLAAAPGAAVKQGWGHDGVDAGRAVANSTGYLDDGRYAVAILTSGAPETYGGPLEGLVTAQARELVSRLGSVGGAPAQPAGAAAAPSAVPAGAASPGATSADAAAGASADSAGPTWVVPVAAGGAAVLAAAGAGWVLMRSTQGRAARQEAERRARRRQQALHRLATTGHAVVRLPSGQLVRIRPSDRLTASSAA